MSTRDGLPHDTFFLLRVELEDVLPPVWRDVVVPAAITLADLHLVLQGAMGWTDTHLHLFLAAGEEYGVPHPSGPPTRDERLASLSALLRLPGDGFVYLYDFGDGWSHRVTLTAFGAAGGVQHVPEVRAGARACPPEDVGGPGGYAEYVEAMADPTHERHAEFVEWRGPVFDPEAFDPDEANVRVAGFFATRPRRRSEGPAGASGESRPRRSSVGVREVDPSGVADGAAWLRLHHAALRFTRAAPWTWLADAGLVGVRDGGGETLWCCALGAGRSVYGLAAYRGAAGLAFHREVQDRAIGPDSASTMTEAYLVQFTSRDNLEDKARRRLRALGFSPRGPLAWTSVELHEAGYIPRQPAPDALGPLSDALDQAREVFERARGEPELLFPDAQGRRLVRTRRGGATDGGWIDLWEAPPPPPAPEPVPEIELARLRAGLPLRDVALEFGEAWPGSVIAPPGEPAFFFVMSVLIDGQTADLLGHAMAEPPIRITNMARRLCACLEAAKLRPRRLLVGHAGEQRALSQVAAALGIKLEFADHVPALDFFRNALASDWRA